MIIRRRGILIGLAVGDAIGAKKSYAISHRAGVVLSFDSSTR